jgi:hypothetical protein
MHTYFNYLGIILESGNGYPLNWDEKEHDTVHEEGLLQRLQPKKEGKNSDIPRTLQSRGKDGHKCPLLMKGCGKK